MPQYNEDDTRFSENDKKRLLLAGGFIVATFAFLIVNYTLKWLTHDYMLAFVSALLVFCAILRYCSTLHER